MSTVGATDRRRVEREDVARPAVALLPFGDVFVDFLDPLGIGIDEFCETFVGSWMFGYVTALADAGVQTVLICPTSKVSAPTRMTHAVSGATIVLLPTGRMFSFLRGSALDGRVDGRRDPSTLARAAATHTAPYAGTPIVALARELRRAAVRAVICQEYETPRFDVCVAVGRSVGVPVFGVFQGGDEQHSVLERPLRPLAMRFASGLLSGSSAELARVRTAYDVPAARLFGVPNPVDVSFWRPCDRGAARAALGIGIGARVVAWHGQLIQRKGIDVLLAAWESVCAERVGRELVLLLVGGGEQEAKDEIRRRIADRQIEGVRLVDGWVDDREQIRQTLAAADVYAFPSRREGVPVAPAEAMACGLPVVGSSANGIPDVIGRCGLVVEPDDAAALAAALGSLLDDDALRTSLGRAARVRAEEHFSHTAVGSRLRSILLGRP